jgi:NAD(P)-dependent dehydrogenase (short-subunit alcohol dehydrogenase family)
MTGWLGGSRALVVGGGSGIGRAVVDAFLDEGARVAVLEKSPAKCAQLRAAEESIVVIEGDATTWAANTTAVNRAVAEFGGIDVLVNCVGVFDFYQGLRAIDSELIEAAFEEMFAVNVKAQMYSVKAAASALAAVGGRVVLTESTSAYYPDRGGVLYVSSKFAVRGLVASLAYELAPEVRVNGVAPGGTMDTDLRGLDTLGLGERRLADSPGRAQELARRVPLRVALTPADHAWSYVFLASERSRGITGDVLHSDGGVGLRHEAAHDG